jgi:hypothetical protein
MTKTHGRLTFKIRFSFVAFELNGGGLCRMVSYSVEQIIRYKMECLIIVKNPVMLLII